MIESLSINNFRGFREVRLENLARVNVLVGDNGSGKTALLESLFMAGGIGPEIYLRTRAWRGIGEKIQIGLDRDQYEALWKEIFYGLDQTISPQVSFSDSELGRRQLTIYYDTTQTRLMPIDFRERTSFESGDIFPITFEWSRDNGQLEKVTADVTPQGMMTFNQIKNPFPIMFFSATLPVAPEENAKRFSHLSRRKRDSDAVNILRSLFPVIQDLSVEIVAGLPGLYATVDGVQEKMSIGSLSGGLNRFMSILFGIAASPRGVVLVDELENGFFHEKYSSVWKSVVSLAKTLKTQLFVSTHSAEFLNSAFNEIKVDPDSFSLIRTERSGGKCNAKRFAGKDLLAGVEQRIDVR
jgi:AAA15 family ATPase/GTPase